MVAPKKAKPDPHSDTPQTKLKLLFDNDSITTDCFIYAIQFLPLKEICTTLSVSTRFHRCGQVARRNVKKCTSTEFKAVAVSQALTYISEHCPKIEQADFHGADVNFSSIKPVLQKCRKIVELNVTCVRGFTTPLDSIFPHIANITNLTHLRTREIPIQHTDLLYIAKCDRLVKLELHPKYKTRATGLNTLLENCSKLTKLQLNNFVDVPAVLFQFSQEKHSRITALQLWECEIDDHTCGLLARCFPNVRMLDLWDNGLITEKGIKNLCSLNLKWLDIGATKATLDTIRYIASKEVFPNLEKLVVPWDDNTHLQDDFRNFKMAERIMKKKKKCKTLSKLTFIWTKGNVV